MVSLVSLWFAKQVGYDCDGGCIHQSLLFFTMALVFGKKLIGSSGGLSARRVLAADAFRLLQTV